MSTRQRHRGWGWSLAYALALAAPIPAQQPAIPIFKAATRLVQVPVIVDSHGTPLSGLTADDFTVTDNGKPQAIKFFNTTTPLASAPAAPAATAPAPAAGTAFTNVPTPAEAQQPHPTVVVLLDDLNSTLGMEMSQGQPAFFQGAAFQYAKNQLANFVRSLPTEDHVALYGLSDKLAMLSDFSSDRKQLLAALAAYKPISNWTSGIPADQSGTDVPDPAFDRQSNSAAVLAAQLKGEDSGQTTMQALRAIANHLALVPGRVSLVWLTANPAVAGATVAASLGTDRIAVYPVDARGLLPREGLVAKSGKDGFPLSNRGMIGYLQAQLPGQGALRDIAEQTGGEAFLNTNDIASSIQKAAQDSESSYMLGFYLEPSALDNSFHHISVRVRGHALETRYPRGYWALADNSPDRQRAGAMAMAIASPEDAAGIPIRASLRRMPGSGPAMYRLDGSIDVRGFAWAEANGAHSGTIMVALAEENVAGSVLWRGTRAIPLHLDDAAYAQLGKSGIPLELDIKAEPGASTLRLIIQDPASGATGSLIMPLAQVQ